MDLGGQTGTSGDRAGIVDLGVGYNVSSNVYLGVVTGAYPYFGVVDGLDSDVTVPLMADLSFRLNPFSEGWSPFVSFRGGYLMHTSPNAVLTDTQAPYVRQGYRMLEASCGIDIRCQRHVDLRLSLGYALALAGDDGFSPARNCDQHMLQARLGIGLRAKAKGPSHAELLADMESYVRSEHRREYEDLQSRRRAEAEQHEQESRRHNEQQRRQRQRDHEQTLMMQEGMMNEQPYGFFCHVTPSMLRQGTRHPDLERLAKLVAGKNVATIVVLGYSPNAQAMDIDVAGALAQARKVEQVLNKTYRIKSELIVKAAQGFEGVQETANHPVSAVATIMIQLTVE